ncbi:hypothetical protein [Bradyrhizobium yuanmingense]|uniref:hypothetical protein n=1 Tax=Bradyrhizobium yuanmingense TaxID=108015 RepID=UPI00114D3841|nr:hypothetical protein [Bradyrhizobium yuanmingense]
MTLATVAMMALWHCFARRDRIYFVNPKNFLGPAQAFVLKGGGLLCMGLFSHFCIGIGAHVPRGGMLALKRDCEIRHGRYS